jgi:cellulose synthase/poly-beta-1,6-N-acetylglucosamine synthase-like glycosyltransferase
MGARVVQLDLTRPFTAARARNAGFSAIRALNPEIQFIQFIDGDCTLRDNWISKARAFLDHHEDVAIVCGRRRERHPDVSVYNKICDIEWDTPIGNAQASGGDALVRVCAFEVVGGFREELIAGEEPELCLRLRKVGWKIWRLDEEMTLHDAAMTQFKQWWVRTIRTGYGMADVVHLHLNSSLSIWKRELARTIAWGALLPLVIVLAGFLQHYLIALCFLGLYPIQVCRIAIARGWSQDEYWAYALFVMIGKFAEFQGVLKFCWSRVRRSSIELIEYKRN